MFQIIVLSLFSFDSRVSQLVVPPVQYVVVFETKNIILYSSDG